MLLPGAAAFAILTRRNEFRPVLAGTVEFRSLTKRAIGLRAIGLRTVLARARKARTLIAAAVVSRFVITRLVETSGTVAGGAGITPGMVGRTGIALLPRFGFATVGAAFGAAAKILARASVTRVALAIPGRAAREFLVAAEFSIGAVATRPVAIARRPRTIGAISTGPVTVLAKALTARGVGPLLTSTLTRRIRPLVAEFLVGEACRRTRIAARRVRALFSTAIVTGGVGTLFAAAAALWTIGKRPIAARTRRVAIITARSVCVAAWRRALALAGVRFARARIGLLVI